MAIRKKWCHLNCAVNGARNLLAFVSHLQSWYWTVHLTVILITSAISEMGEHEISVNKIHPKNEMMRIYTWRFGTWFSFKGVGCWYWTADRTNVVMASMPHSLMRLRGWLQTSSKWLVTGRHRTSTRFKFTRPVSNNFATAKSEGSYRSNKWLSECSFPLFVPWYTPCWNKLLLGLPARVGATRRSNGVKPRHLNIGLIQTVDLTWMTGRANRPAPQPCLALGLQNLFPSKAGKILENRHLMVLSQESKLNADHMKGKSEIASPN